MSLIINFNFFYLLNIFYKIALITSILFIFSFSITCYKVGKIRKDYNEMIKNEKK